MEETKTKKISTTIPLWLYEEVKTKNRWAWNDIIIMGFQTKKNMPNVLKRQNDVESTTERLVAKLNKLANERYELEEKVNQLSEKVLLLENKNI